MSWITAMPLPLGDAISYLASEVRPAVERQPGNLGTSLLIDPESGVIGFESFWASDGPLVASEDVIAASVREAARRAGGTVTREHYEIMVFELEAPLRGGQGARVTHMDVEPSKLSNVEDAVAWYGDTIVPRLSDASGFCAATLYAESAAIVAKICVEAGQMVHHGARLVELSPAVTSARSARTATAPGRPWSAGRNWPRTSISGPR